MKRTTTCCVLRWVMSFRGLLAVVLVYGAATTAGCAAFERGETEEELVVDTSGGGDGGEDSNGGNPGDDTGDPGTDTGPEPDGGGPSGPGFEADVHPVLVSACGTCHSSSGMAGSTGFKLTMDVDADYENVVALVDVDNPGNSDLIRKGTNESAHAGGAAFEPGGEEVVLIENWITSGLLP